MTEQQPAYVTPAGNTVALFEAFHDGAQGGNPTTLEVTLEVASDVVATMTALPADADSDTRRDYTRRRKNAELLLARWIWDTDAGQTSSKGSVVGTSISYASNPAVRSIVAGSMGEFLEEEADGGGTDDGKAYVGYL